MSILDIFKRPPAPSITFRPSCDDCQRFREMIAFAEGARDFVLAGDLRREFAEHCQTWHVRRKA